MPDNKRIFDTAVQKLKYDVLKAIIRNEYEHCYENIWTDIPKEISPGPKATMRCCIFKERAIVQERMKLALGGIRTTRTSSKSSTSPATSARSAVSL